MDHTGLAGNREYGNRSIGTFTRGPRQGLERIVPLRRSITQIDGGQKLRNVSGLTTVPDEAFKRLRL